MAFNHSWQVALHPGESDDFFRPGPPPVFIPDADEFSPVNAWWLSELSRLIYKRDHTEGVASALSRADHLDHVGLKEVRFFSHPNIQAALVETVADDPAAFAALVFRGTAGRLLNWRFNLDIASCPWPSGGRVHRGFGRLLKRIWPAIAADLQAVGQPLYFTGHSLGGALAILAASLHPARAVYSFGAPRIGNRAFARTLADARVFNITNPHDIVTHLPPAGPGFRFCHVGTTIKNREWFPPSRRPFAQAPNFLAGHAPLNYSAQLPV